MSDKGEEVENNENKEINEKPAEQNEIHNKKKVRKFYAKEFRRHLTSNSSYDAIKEFVQLCTQENSSQDCALEYLEAGGGCIELVRVIETSENKNASYVLPVMEALSIILLKIISSHPQKTLNGEESCRELLNKHFKIIKSMLALSSNTIQRMVALKLLATMVTLSSKLAKEVIVLVFLDESCLKVLTNPSNEEDANSVRTSYIHFIISFLIEGHSDLIQLLFQKNVLIQSIFPGLVYDVPDIINVFLSTIQKSVLENPDLSKTVKMGIFSQKIIKTLINLFEWKGPNSWNPTKKKQSSAIVVNQQDKQFVCEITHDFLKVLCTSRKHGIVFQDETLGLSNKKHNSLLSNVVKSLNKPWNNAFVSDLVVHICAACPDLIKEVLYDVESSLEPRDSQNWLNITRFIKCIIEKLEPKNVEKFLAKLTVKQLFNVLQMFCAPQSVLKIVTTEAVIHEHVGIRHESLFLLLAMLNSLEKYLIVIENSKEISLQNKQSLKVVLTNYLSKNLPATSVLLKNWQEHPAAITDESIVPIPEYNIHLTLLLDVLYKYRVICPELVDQVTKELDINELLKTIDELTTAETVLRQVKSINLFITCDSSLFHPSKDLFSYCFPLLLKLYYESSENLKNDIEPILSKMLAVSGIFEGCDHEIMVFLYSILELDSYSDEFGIYLSTVFKDTCENFFKYNNELAAMTDTNNDNFGTFSIQSWLKTNDKLKTADVRIKHKILSPLILGLLNGLLQHSEMSPFVNKILVHILFTQTSPNILISLLQNKYKSVCGKYLTKYCKHSEDISALDNLKKIVKSDSSFSQIFDFIFNNEIDFDINSLDWRPYYSTLMTNFIIYYYTQSISKKIDQQIQNKCLQVILHIINKSGDNPSLQSCLDSIFRHPVLLQTFLPTKQTIECTKFVIQIIEELLKTKTKGELEIYLEPFRLKLVQNICDILRKHDCKSDNLIEIIQLFDLTFEQSTEVMKIIFELPHTSYVTKENSISIVGQIVSYILHRNYGNLTPFDNEIIKKIGNVIQKLNNSQINLEGLENSFCSYVNKFPHVNANFSPDLFVSLITKTNITKSTIKLATTLAKYNKNLITKQLNTHLDSILEKRELVLSLLNTILIFELPDADGILLKVYTFYEPVILKFVNKPQKVSNYLIEYYQLITFLVGCYMSNENCNKITSKVQKFDVTEYYHTEVLTAIFTKSIKSETDETKKIKLVINFIVTLMNLLTNALKRPEKSENDWTKIENISKAFLTHIIKIKKIYEINNLDETIYTNAAFQNFSKLCLKFGLQDKPILIKILKQLSSLTGEKNDQFGVLFEMAIAHSESLNILLSESELKAQLLGLLLILCKKCPSVMAKSHIPVWLGAYGATLTESNQYLLQLLMLYEQAGLGFHEYRPYLWGAAAVSHYSVKTGGTTTLWRQPNPKNVLEIFNEDKIKNTIVNFARTRQLRPSETLYSDGELDVYDPAFYLPLLSHILAPESIIRWYHISNKGILSLVVICLTSESKDIRAAACLVLARFHGHLEAAQNANQRLLWQHLVESICRGISALPDVYLSTPVAVFLCRCVTIFSKPDDALYKPLGHYITAKECPNFGVVPELLEMLFNTSVIYKDHRVFILQVIRDGLKTKKDLEVVFRSMTFKLIMDLYNSTLSNIESKKIILEILAAAVTIPLGSQVLLTYYSFLSWLQTVLSTMQSQELDLLIPVIDIINNLMTHTNYTRLKFFKFKILHILVSTIDILKNSQVELSYVVKFVKCLYLTYERRPDILNKSQLCNLLDFCSKFVDCNICNYYLQFGTEFVEQSFLSNDDPKSIICYHLQLITLGWIEVNKII